MAESQKKQKNNATLKALLMLVVAAILVIIFIILALLLAPGTAIPEFNITDQGGEWKAQGTIAVFDDMIKPGSDGEYKFIIKNESEGNLNYGFKLSEYLNNMNVNAQPFMQYRLKMDNVYLVDEEWHYVGLDYDHMYIMSGSEHLMTLEWRWPFENGRDGNDTLVGRTGGKLSIVIFIWAEVDE